MQIKNKKSAKGAIFPGSAVRRMDESGRRERRETTECAADKRTPNDGFSRRGLIEGRGRVERRGRMDGRERLERNVFGGKLRFEGFLSGGLEFAINGDVGILVEAGIALHARFGLFAAPEDAEIMPEEADTPFHGSIGMIVLEGVSHPLSRFNEFAVGNTAGRPGCREMVGIELQEVASAARNTADDDVFVVMTAFLNGIHGAPEHFDGCYGHEIAHSPSVGSGNLRMRRVVRDSALQTVFYDRFQVSSHLL